MTLTANTLFLRLALARLREHWSNDALRELALAEIERWVEALGADLPIAVNTLVEGDARLLSIAMHAADVLRGISVPLEPAPYVMTVATRSYRGPGISVDADGFRTTLQGAVPLSWSDFLTGEGPGALLVGNSTSWGVGVSSDAGHVASQLSADGTRRVFNASVKGTNAYQQWLMAEHRLPAACDVIVVGGVLDLIFALSWPRDAMHGALPFWNVGDPDLTTSEPWGVAPGEYDGDTACEVLRGALNGLGVLGRTRGGRVLFVLQPHLDFSRRVVTSREARLAEAFSREVGSFKPVYAAGILRNHASAFTSWLREACMAAGIDCIDANQHPAFEVADELFLDAIHLNDRGHAQLGALIRSWLEE